MLPWSFAQWPKFRSALTTLTELLRDGTQFLTTITRARAALRAEVLFLRKQLAYYQELWCAKISSEITQPSVRAHIHDVTHPTLQSRSPVRLQRGDAGWF